MPEMQTRMQLAFPSPTKLFTPAVTTFIILMIAGFILTALNFGTNSLALNPQKCFPFQPWQLVSYPFISNSPMNLVFSGLMLLFIGSAIEREWKSMSFVLLWLTVSVVCGVIWVLVNLMGGWNFVGMGAGACSYGLIATFGLLNRRRRLFMMFFTIEAQHLILIFIAIGIIMSITTPIRLIWIAGAPVAYIYVKLLWRKDQQKLSNEPSPGRQRSEGFVDLD